VSNFWATLGIDTSLDAICVKCNSAGWTDYFKYLDVTILSGSQT